MVVSLQSRNRSSERGVTLAELLVVLGITALLVTIGAAAVRHYWLVRSLEGGADEVVTHLRRQQERAISESHPKIFGARFRLDSAEWGLVLFDPGPTPDTCTQVDARRFNAGVIVSSDPALTSFATAVSDGVDVTAFCQSQTGWANDRFVFFYPKGTATAGTLTLSLPSLGRTEQITVAALTGRVDRQ